MGQAIKIGGIDNNNMIGVWARKHSESPHGETLGIVAFYNPFNSTDITVECNIITTDHTVVPITSMAIGNNNLILLYFDSLETGVSIVSARCKVYINRN